MLSLATTKISILRGTDTNDFGDEIDTTEPYKRDIPASLIKRSKTIFDPVSGTPRKIRFSVCRVNNGTDIRDGDRIKDQKDNAIYAIDDIETPESPTNAADMRLDLSKVN